MQHTSRRTNPVISKLARVLLAAALLWTGATAVRTQTERGADAEGAATRTAGAPAGQPLELDDVGGGELLWKSPRGLVPLPITGLEVELSVTGVMVHGKLTQRFHNPAAEVIEALYVFPLPERAAVHHMEMRIGDRSIVSVVQEKEEARRTYEKARATGRRTALVDQRRPNLFTTSVANLNPGETVSIVLEYIEQARYDDGSFSLRFPLTFTPRFMPGLAAQANPGEPHAGEEPPGRPAPELAAPFVPPGDAAAPRASVAVRLRPGFALEQAVSRSHDLLFRNDGESLEITTRPAQIVADRDFLLSWRPALGEEPRGAAFIEELPEGRFALLMLIPPIPGSEAGLGLPTETLFVIDVSGSMQGPSIVQARRALLASLDRLRPEDRFNILKFNDDSVSFRETFQQAEAEPLDAARRWVRDLEAGGGTMIHPALMRGLSMMGDSRSSHAQRIVFLTDGAVGNEQQVLAAVVERLGETRLHTIGIGQAPNAYLMRRMARLGRGLCEFISDGNEAEGRVEAFFERLDRPVMTDLVLRREEIELEELYPRRLPDLYAGEPLLLSAKLQDGPMSGSLELGGQTRSGWITTSMPVDAEAPRGRGIALRWARAKVHSLMDSLHEGADPADVRAEVVDLGLSFHMVTAYTSLVAVDDRASALGRPRPLRMASVLPRGGSDGPLRLLAGWALVLIGLGFLLLLRWGSE
jgi:Ca-activated chloride channel family protein